MRLGVNLPDCLWNHMLKEAVCAYTTLCLWMQQLAITLTRVLIQFLCQNTCSIFNKSLVELLHSAGPIPCEHIARGR